MYDDIIENKGEILHLKFNKVPLLLKGEKKIIEAKSKVGGLIDEPLLKQIMINSKIPLIFTIRYRDLTGRSYFTRIKVLDAAINIITAPTKYTLYRKLTYIYFRLKEQVLLNTKGRYLLFKFARDNRKEQ